MTSKDVSGAADRPLWHGRMSVSPAEELLAFTRSLPFDLRLWRDDIAGTTAHVTMLGKVGLLDATETAQIIGALTSIAADFEDGVFGANESIEDIHSLLEIRVTEMIGEAGAKMHTARSRNDQVATALRLWCRREMRLVAADVMSLIGALADRADEADAATPPLVVAAYTHVQRAQIVLLSHHLRAHVWALLRDVDRIADALRRMDVSPLGAGATGGTTLPIDPRLSADLLGFDEVFANSMDAVSDRDFVLESLFVLATIGTHLSRVGEEVVLWSSSEFGFVVLDDAHSTGSSMLPQKKNADIAELARGKSGRLTGNLVAVLTMLKGLPLSYNRDLQDDKEPLFDSVDTVRGACRALAGMISTMRFVPERLEQSTSGAEIAAIDLAEDLVGRGMPFRHAHAVVGSLVARAMNEGRSFVELVRESPDFGPEYEDFFDAQASLARRTSHGGGGHSSASTQSEDLRRRMSAVASAIGMAD